MHQVDVFKGGLVEVPSLEPDGLSGLGQALLLLGAQVDVTVLGGAKSRGTNSILFNQPEL